MENKTRDALFDQIKGFKTARFYTGILLPEARTVNPENDSRTAPEAEIEPRIREANPEASFVDKKH